MRNPMTPLQFFSLWAAHTMAITSLILVLVWVLANQDNDYYLGGLSFSGTGLFNWHPVCMVAGLVVFYTKGLLAYRTLPLGKETNKIIHNVVMLCAAILVSLGLWAVFAYHNEELYANLYSVHSWAGIVVVTLFYLNYLGGFFMFFAKTSSQKFREEYLPKHRFIGIFTYFAAAFTCVLGIQDKNSALGCSYDYTLDEPDYDPAEHYLSIYEGCRLSNGLGITIILTCLFATFAVMDFKKATSAQQENLANPLL